MVRKFSKKCIACRRIRKMFKSRVTCSPSCAKTHKNNDKLRNSRKKK